MKEINKQAVHPFPFWTLIVLWLVGWTLRVPILAAPPLASRISDSFGLGEAGTGALTMLPLVAVAFGAIPAALIVARFGLRVAIMGGIIVMVVASVARGYVPSSTLLFISSVIMGLGVAVFQTALPAATRIWTPTHVALGSAVYLNGMMVGELFGAGLTLPMVLPLAGGDWRYALVLWSIPILIIAALVWTINPLKRDSKSLQSKTVELSTEPPLPRFNDKQVWQFGLLLAGSVLTFYVINTYVASLLHARGETKMLEELLFAYNAMPLLASFLILIKPNWIGLRGPIAVSAVFSAIGLAGFVFLSNWPSWIFALLAGFAATVELILLISLPATIASGMAVTRLSAGMTLIGYAIAFALPLLGGYIADKTELIEMTIIPSLVFIVVVLLALGRNKRYPMYK